MKRILILLAASLTLSFHLIGQNANHEVTGTLNEVVNASSVLLDCEHSDGTGGTFYDYYKISSVNQPSEQWALSHAGQSNSIPPYVPEKKFCENSSNKYALGLCVMDHLDANPGIDCFTVHYNSSNSTYYADDDCPPDL
jgi:hypothetical protein